MLANILCEAHLDGEPSPAVAAYLQLLHDGMGFPPADYEADAQVFRSLRERTLFQESDGQK